MKKYLLLCLLLFTGYSQSAVTYYVINGKVGASPELACGAKVSYGSGLNAGVMFCSSNGGKISIASCSNYFSGSSCTNTKPSEGGCASGFIYDSGSDSCIPDPAQCGSGQVMNEYGKCEASSEEENKCAKYEGVTLSKQYATGCGKGYSIGGCMVTLSSDTTHGGSDNQFFGDWKITGEKAPASCTGDGEGSGTGEGGEGEGNGEEGGDDGSGGSGSGSGSGGSGSGTGEGEGEGNGNGNGSGNGNGDGEGEEDKPSAGGLSCSQSLTCKGDAVQCAQLEKQKQIKCDAEELYKMDAEVKSDLQQQVNKNTKEIEGLGDSNSPTVNIGNMISKGTGWLPRSCPAPAHFNVHGKTFELSYENTCNLATNLSGLIVALFSFLGIRVFARQG